MKCPACSRELRPVEVADIVVDVCENGCGGVWFDNHELKKVDEQHESAGEKLLQFARDPSVALDHTQKRNCPHCADQPMFRHFMSVKREVGIDECPGCGGVWLDAGELRRIRNQYENEQERERAANEHFDDVFGDELAQAHEENQRQMAGARQIARILRFICPSHYVPGKQGWGAF